VDECRFDRRPQLSLGRHVGDGIVDKHSVEMSAEAHGAHIPWTCSQSGLRRRLALNMPGARYSFGP
jgi:hypothetical protein